MRVCAWTVVSDVTGCDADFPLNQRAQFPQLMVGEDVCATSSQWLLGDLCGAGAGVFIQPGKRFVKEE